MNDATLIDAVKEYGRYKNGRKTSVGVFLNIIIVSTAVFMGLCFLFAKMVMNNEINERLADNTVHKGDNAV